MRKLTLRSFDQAFNSNDMMMKKMMLILYEITMQYYCHKLLGHSNKEKMIVNFI